MTQRLKAQRALKEMTQAEVAKYIGIGLTAYYQKENGHSEFTLSEIKKILELFEVKFEDLF